LDKYNTGDKKMKIKIWTPLVMACLIIASAFVGMSIEVKPPHVEASTQPYEHENQTGAHGTISITGSAFRDCFPDRLVIYLRIVGKDTQSAITARDQAATILDKTLKALKSIGISEEDIGTTSYDIQPIYEWENGQRVFKEYRATVTIKVTLKEKQFDKAGNVIDVSVDAGSYVDSINFELSREKRDEVNLELLAEAAKDAKLRASTIVTALGDTLGDVKSINLDNYGYQPMVYWRNSYLESDISASSVPPTTILPSDLTVSANVNVVFEIL